MKDSTLASSCVTVLSSKPSLMERAQKQTVWMQLEVAQDKGTIMRKDTSKNSKNMKQLSNPSHQDWQNLD